MKETICALCGIEFSGYGNNPAPLAEGRCCDVCNTNYVIPARIHLTTGRKKQYQQIVAFLRLAHAHTKGEPAK